MALLRRAYECTVFYGEWVVFGISSFLWSLLAGILYPLLSRRLGEPLGQFMIMAGFRYFVWIMTMSRIVKCDLSALDVLRRDTSIIITANHPSLLDAVLIISRLPRVLCIMKPAIWNNLFLGGGARLAGFIRNDTPTILIKRSAERMRAGNQLLIFPEGTRTVHGILNEFKGGFALVAKIAGAPIQTVFIETNSPFLGKNWPLFTMPQLPLHYRVTLGKRFEAPKDVKTFVAELESYYRAELNARATRPQ